MSCNDEQGPNDDDDEILSTNLRYYTKVHLPLTEHSEYIW